MTYALKYISRLSSQEQEILRQEEAKEAAISGASYHHVKETSVEELPAAQKEESPRGSRQSVRQSVEAFQQHASSG